MSSIHPIRITVNFKNISNAGRTQIFRSHISHTVTENLLILMFHSASPDPINLIDNFARGQTATPLAKSKLDPSAIDGRPTLGLKSRPHLAQGTAPKKSTFKMASIEFQGVDLTSEAGQVASIDWR